jgi:cob(I)alamin adenosyltransferase
MKIYTRDGDDGTTSLAGGKRIPKHYPRVDAYGNIDEVISWIGLLKDQSVNSERKELLFYIQDQLMRCASSLATDPEKIDKSIILPEVDCITKLELAIDIMDRRLTPMTSFIIPGGHPAISFCHLARCVCRRTERSVILLKETEFVHEIIIRFLNRLSDFLFVLSRIICLELDIEEVKWHS